jgi:hypothetical protein
MNVMNVKKYETLANSALACKSCSGISHVSVAPRVSVGPNFTSPEFFFIFNRPTGGSDGHGGPPDGIKWIQEEWGIARSRFASGWSLKCPTTLIHFASSAERTNCSAVLGREIDVWSPKWRISVGGATTNEAVFNACAGLWKTFANRGMRAPVSPHFYTVGFSIFFREEDYRSIPMGGIEAAKLLMGA